MSVRCHRLSSTRGNVGVYGRHQPVAQGVRQDPGRRPEGVAQRPCGRVVRRVHLRARVRAHGHTHGTRT
eukprot:6599278-Lingulodinium_polyedra.AAC.1